MSYILVLNKLKLNPRKKFCFLNSSLEKKYIKKNINYKTLNFKNLSNKRLEKLNKKNYLISENIIIKLAFILNKIHGLELSKKSWKIIIGPWVHHFTTICWNRFDKIKKVLKNPNLDTSFIFECPNNLLSIEDNCHMFKLCNDDNWNSILYSKALLFLKPNQKYKKKRCSIPIVNHPETKKFNIKILFSQLLNFLKKDTDAVIDGSYLPFKEMLKLHLHLGQFPQFYSYLHHQNIKLLPLKKEYRKKIRLNYKRGSDFENFLFKIIPAYFPKCHLENFSTLKKKVDKSYFPRNPKFIYTSNNFEFDEIFKLFTALQVEKKTKYIIGQHGNISSIENMFDDRIHSADNYLNWGKRGFGKSEDGFNFKLINQSFLNNKQGSVLILDTPFGTNNKIYDRIEQNFTNTVWLKELLKQLKNNCINNVVLKLHTSWKKKDKNYINNLKSIFPEIKIEIDDKKIFSLMQDARCVIHTYNSTGILESMSLNIPTFCIWPNKLNYIQKKFHMFYYHLEINKILYYNNKDLVKTIKKHYQNIDRWWLRKDRVKAKNFFLKQFSIIPKKNSTKNLAKKLLYLSSN